MARETAREKHVETSPLDRRSYLKLAGVALATTGAATVTSDTARAATGGYGEGQFGDGAYGDGSTEPPLSVTTGEATNVSASTAKLTGEVTEMGGASSVAAYFEYRNATESDWHQTGSKTLSAGTTFSASAAGLDGGSDYVFRAVVDASDGDSTTASEKTFSTPAVSGKPEITTFTVSKSEQLGTDRMFTVKWAVADDEGDLDTVEVAAIENTLSMNFDVTNVSGESASGWEIFQFPVDTTLDVVVRVTDANGTVTKETRTITL